MSKKTFAECVTMTDEAVFHLVNEKMRAQFAQENKTWVDICKKQVRSEKDGQTHDAYVISKSMFGGYRDIEIVQDADGGSHVEWDSDDKAKYKDIWESVVRTYAAEKLKMNAAAAGYAVEEVYDKASHNITLYISC